MRRAKWAACSAASLTYTLQHTALRLTNPGSSTGGNRPVAHLNAHSSISNPGTSESCSSATQTFELDRIQLRRISHDHHVKRVVATSVEPNSPGICGLSRPRSPWQLRRASCPPISPDRYGHAVRVASSVLAINRVPLLRDDCITRHQIIGCRRLSKFQ